MSWRKSRLLHPNLRIVTPAPSNLAWQVDGSVAHEKLGPINRPRSARAWREAMVGGPGAPCAGILRRRGRGPALGGTGSATTIDRLRPGGAPLQIFRPPRGPGLGRPRRGGARPPP